MKTTGAIAICTSVLLAAACSKSSNDPAGALEAAAGGVGAPGSAGSVSNGGQGGKGPTGSKPGVATPGNLRAPAVGVQLAGSAGGAGADGGAAGASTGGASSCPSGKGSPMVRLHPPDSPSYCIDVHEASQADYAAFLSTGDVHPKGGELTSCAATTTHAIQEKTTDDFGSNPCPKGSFNPAKTGTLPVACVSWCDANAYCQWAGKRLCGMRGAQGVQHFPDAIDANKGDFAQETAWACSGGGKQAFPYGSSKLDGACVESGTGPLAVDRQTPCHGAAVDGQFVVDLVGNVAEWTSTCVDYPTGPDCYLTGGSWTDDIQSLKQAKCDGTTVTIAAGPLEFAGIRCCAD